jgi:hypothetical protein
LTGLFSGDRFIPYRPEETHFGGCEQFRHEENLLNNNLLRVPRKHRDEDANMSSDSNSRRSHSTPSSHTSSNSSQNSNRSASERVHRASRRRQLAYESMLNQHCFQDSSSHQNLSLAETNTHPGLSVAPVTRDQAKAKQSVARKQTRILKFKKPQHDQENIGLKSMLHSE